MRQRFRIKPYSPILAMVILFVGIVTFSLVQMMRETNAIDVERTRHAMAAATQAEIQQLVTLVDDNAFWDDATIAVYSGMKDVAFLESAWRNTTEEARAYDTALILNSQRKAILAYETGAQTTVDVQARYGHGMATLLDKLAKTGKPGGGFIKTAKGIQIVAVAQVTPTDERLAPMIPAAGPYTLVFARQVNSEIITKLGESVQLNGARLITQTDLPTTIRIADPAGEIVARLAWDPPLSGNAAVRRALPLVISGTIILILIAWFMARQSFATIHQLVRQALSDSLSGLPNRRALRRDLSECLLRNKGVALAMFDLDGFKGINDNYGHSVGDRLIKLVAELLVREAGKNATVARLGGDEFAIVLAGDRAVIELEMLAERLLAILAQPFHIDERTVLIGASIGLTNGSGIADAGELMRRADVAMYAAKRAGKMRLTWYDQDLDQRQSAAHAIEMELRAAIDREAFDLVYQPVFGILDRKIIAVEALLRWNSPTRGVISPSEFIPVAEETGLIDRIGMIVLRRACRDGLRWTDVRLAVNVSPAQLRNPDFAIEVAKVLRETGLPAHRLEIEITETYLVHDPETARRVLNELRAIGVGIALDDFGTGFASISFLQQFNFTRLKLDRSLVDQAGDSAPTRTVVQASIAVAKALDMEVTAEGVETDAQADLMRVAGCNQLQGWFFSHPVIAAKISDWVAQDQDENSTGKAAGQN